MMEWIEERIIEHTQPSPSEVRIKHDYTPGNHTRSALDNSLVCVPDERCHTKPVHYLWGTKKQLWESILAEMQDAVRTADLYFVYFLWVSVCGLFVSSVGDFFF